MRINASELAMVREDHEGRQIVFCSGTFDLTHAGHVLFFEDCKKLGDVLVVGVGGDVVTRTLKGDLRPVINEHARMKIVESLRQVDYCFLIPSQLQKDGPLVFLGSVFEKLKPEIYAVNDDAFEIMTRHRMAQEHGVRLAVLQRWCPAEFEEISTTNIIRKAKGSPLQRELFEPRGIPKSGDTVSVFAPRLNGIFKIKTARELPTDSEWLGYGEWAFSAENSETGEKISFSTKEIPLNELTILQPQNI